MIHSIKSWLNKQSLHFKLNVSILTCVVLVFLFLVVYITIRAKPLIYEQTESIAEKSIEAYAFDLSHLVKDTEQSVINIKNTLGHFPENDIESIKISLTSALNTVYHSDLNFVNAWVYAFSDADNSKGTFYISQQLSSTNTTFKAEKVQNLHEQYPWLINIPETAKVYWSEPYIDKMSNLMVVTCFTPFSFLNNKSVNGYAALTVNLSNIQNSISSYSFYETGKLLLLSNSGLYITHPNPDISLKTTVYELAEKLKLPDLSRAGKEMTDGKHGKFEVPYSSIFDSPTIYFYAPIKNIKWGMFLVYEKDAFLKPIFKFQILIFFSLLVGALLISVLVNFICKHSTSQLLELGKIANQYGKGSFSDDFSEEPSSKDIGILSKALTSMRTNLMDYIEKEKHDAVEKQKNESELDIAYKIQQAALSTKYPLHDSFQIATLMIPATQIGGDFYDFFFIDDSKFAIVIADVSGKGMPAALYMMKAQALIKNITKSKFSIGDVFYHVNNELCEGNDTCMFVTAFMAIIDLDSGRVEFVNAGHNPPLLKTTSGYNFTTPKTNIVLGINKDTVFETEVLYLQYNDHILLYTDGVTEAENTSSEFYGKNRLLRITQKFTDDANHNVNLLLKDIRKFEKGKPQSDDITLLEFVYKGLASNSLKATANIKNLHKIVSFVKNDMTNKHISDDIQFKVVIITEEIFSNIAQYAHKKPNIGKATIETSLKDDIYYLTFTDNGQEYNLLDKADPDIDTDITNREIGGLGIFLIKKLADTITYNRIANKNIVKIGIKLSQSNKR